MPVRWARLSDIAHKGVDVYVCAGCGSQETFEDCWSTVPYSVGGKQMMQGYIHCANCRRQDAMVAWKVAHGRENPH